MIDHDFCFGSSRHHETELSICNLPIYVFAIGGGAGGATGLEPLALDIRPARPVGGKIDKAIVVEITERGGACSAQAVLAAPFLGFVLDRGGVGKGGSQCQCETEKCRHVTMRMV